MLLPFRKLDRAWAVYRDLGLREVIRRVRRRLGVNDPQHAEWLRTKAERDERFDQQLGTDTGGIQDIQGHQVAGANAKHGISHIASDAGDFEAMMRDLELPVPEYTFVDLGCGKGRALILAAQHPFARVIGVDFVPAFVESAAANIQAAARRVSFRSEIQVEVGDAAEFSFPDGPVLLYLFNPFDAPIVRRVALNAHRSWQADRRPFTIMYMNPLHVDEVTAAGWRLRQQSSSWARFSSE
jgi:hypothetical protein